MPQIFPRRANLLPILSLVGALVAGVAVVGLIWYYFSPEYTDVGYQPEQPVPYSHQVHVEQLGLDCQYCHTNVDEADFANIPATETCMNCHSQVMTDSENLARVRESWQSGGPIEWVNVHMLPDYAHFDHSRHVNVGVGCETCHGRVDQMEVVTQRKPLSMSWCLDCHRSPEEQLRPPSQVTTMGWEPDSNQVAQNLERIRAEDIAPPTNCSSCHY